jgi:hypothetical protein
MSPSRYLALDYNHENDTERMHALVEITQAKFAQELDGNVVLFCAWFVVRFSLFEERTREIKRLW